MQKHSLKLEKKVIVSGQIKLKTGMHIGGSSIGLAIGGPDKIIVRNPVTQLPYIPGSSLKGKIRSLLEKANNLVTIVPPSNEKDSWKGQICQDLKEDVVQLFGSAADSQDMTELAFAPTRLTVRDASLTPQGQKCLEEAENTDMYCTEVKTEVNIDRLTSAANPRVFERVPAGATFNLVLVVDIYDQDLASDETNETRGQNFLQLLRQGLLLLEDDYIGGQGTRGYGQVEFCNIQVKEKTAEHYQQGIKEPQESIWAELFDGHFSNENE